MIVIVRYMTSSKRERYTLDITVQLSKPPRMGRLLLYGFKITS